MFKTISTVGILTAAVSVLLLSSCSNIKYYAQCVGGHLDLMRRCRPIPQVIEDATTPAELKTKLTTILEVREFASRELFLPENGSYKEYADLERPYVVWNVVAAPEFSLTPLKWCFPVAGCVSYRGYFSKEGAEAFAAGLRNQGHDVNLYGVEAYSTLNWFDDPVLNTFCGRTEPDIAGLIFHELAHQKLYIENDSSFNEAFAKTVELEGVNRWLSRQQDEAMRQAYLEVATREEEFIELVLRARQKLAELYSSSASVEQKRNDKSGIFEQLKGDYQVWKESWGGYPGYDHWFVANLNNAKMVSVSTYRSLVPAFRELLRQQSGDLEGFYRAAAEIGALNPQQRLAHLEQLLDNSDQQKLEARGDAAEQSPEVF